MDPETLTIKYQPPAPALRRKYTRVIIDDITLMNALRYQLREHSDELSYVQALQNNVILLDCIIDDAERRLSSFIHRYNPFPAGMVVRFERLD